MEDKVVRYRAPDASKLEITYTVCNPVHNMIAQAVDFTIHDVDNDEFFCHRLLFGLSDSLCRFVQTDTIASVIDELFLFIIDLVLDGEWNKVPMEKGPRIHYVDSNNSYANRLRISSEGDTIKYRMPAKSLIKQSRMVKNLIFRILYAEQAAVPKFWLDEKIHLPQWLLVKELSALSDLGMVTYQEKRMDVKRIDWSVLEFQKSVSYGHQDLKNEIYEHVRLTAKAEQHYEKYVRTFSGAVFIIMSCSDEYSQIKEFYKKSIENEGLKPYFQEDEKPTSQIILEIYENLKNCMFVIADLTGGSENCLYELGYAHALGKRVIVARCAEEKKDKLTKKLSLPFDLNQFRHSFWHSKLDWDKKDTESFGLDLKKSIKSNWDSTKNVEFKDDIVDSIQKVKEAISQDQFSLELV